jgi:predicted RNA-binding Zn-ribbon protein involved in translation (DUF1610 family)
MSKYCTNCGKPIDDEAVICPNCGRAIESAKRSNDSDSKSWWCLGFFTSLFFTPIIGLILWLVWKDEAPMKAKQVGRGTLWSLLPVAILIAVFIIVYVVAIVGIVAGETTGAITAALASVPLL